MLEGGMSIRKANWKGSSERHILIDCDSERQSFRVIMQFIIKNFQDIDIYPVLLRQM